MAHRNYLIIAGIAAVTALAACSTTVTGSAEDAAPSAAIRFAAAPTKAAVTSAWTPQNEDTFYPRIGYIQTASNLTDRLIEDASYLRLESITLGYTLKLRKWVKFVDSLTINASVNNAFVWTDYSGYDPEVDSFTNDPDRIGIDLNSYPRSRNFVLGISLTF